MNRVINLQQNLPINFIVPFSPKNGAFIRHNNDRFVTLYNSVIDTYGIFKTNKDWSHYYWVPPESYTYPDIQWLEIWKEMDHCSFGYHRKYLFSETIHGPEIHFYDFKL